MHPVPSRPQQNMLYTLYVFSSRRYNDTEERGAFMPATLTSQVNARIDAELKRSGDAALAAAGLTPTQAVRALWDLATHLADAPGKLRELLLPEERTQRDRKLDGRTEHRLQLVRQGASIMDDALRAQGVTPPDQHEHSDLTFEELRQLAYREQFPDFSWGD